MDTVYKKISTHALIRATIYIGLGTPMIVYSRTVTNIIVYVLAGYVALLGIIVILNFIRCRSQTCMAFDLISGIVLIFLGSGMIFHIDLFINFLPIFLGAIIIVSAAISLAQSIFYGRIGQ